MNLSKLGCLLVLSLVSCASSGAGSNAAPWQKHRVAVGEVELSFEVPPGAAADFPVFEGPKLVAVAAPGVFNAVNQGPDLFRRYWSFGRRAFKQPDGLLLFAVLLRKSDFRLHDETALEASVVRNDDLFWKKQPAGAGGRGRLYFDKATIAGRQGLLVRSTTSRLEYVVALDENHYIEVVLEPSGQGNLRKLEQAVVDRIFASLQISP